MSVERKLLLSALCLVALLVGAVVLVYRNHAEQREIQHSLLRLHQTDRQLQLILNLLVDAETGTRGYFVTTDERFLDPYEEAERQLPGEIERLKRLVVQTEQHEKRLSSMDAAVRKKLEWVRTSVSVAREQGIEEARRLIATAKGMELMDEVRAQVAAIHTDQQKLIEDRRTASQVHERTRVVVSSLLIAIIILVLCTAYLLVRFHLAERKTAEAERDRMFALSLDIICVVNGDGYFIRLNSAATQILGWSEEELRSRPLLEFVLPEDRESTREALEALAAGNPTVSFENRYVCKGGGTRAISWRGVPEADGFIYATGRDVTQRRKAEEALRQSEHNLAVTLQSIGDAVLATDRHGKVIRMNRVAEQLTGWTFAEAEGQPVEEVFQIIDERTRTPKPIPVAEVLETGEIRGIANHTILVSRNGSERPIADSAAPIRDGSGHVHGVVLVFRDVTKASAAERALRASEEYNRSIVESTRDCLAVLSLDGRIVGAPTRDCEIMQGADIEKVRGTDWRVLWDKDGASLAAHAITSACQGESGRFRGFRPMADGTPKWWDVTISPIRGAEGRIERLLAVARDVTEQKRAEQAIESARQQADQANLAKSEFLSRMSHELRTPMNAILGFAQVMEMAGAPPAFKVPLEHIMKAGRHLLELINEVLDIARIEAGRMTISLEPVPLGSVVAECIALIRPLATQRQISIESTLDSTDGRHVFADRQRLKQALLNILSNAVKFNKDGGSIEVWAADSACPAQTGTDPRSRLFIADSGSGIPATELPRLFEPFERLDADARGIQGTGLGLALTKRLLALMGASIHVESELNRGTTFAIDFRGAEAPVAHRLNGHAEPAPAVSLGSQSILYIEDNLSNFQLIEHILAGYPHIKLLAAMQGGLGIELAREHRPDLILLDLHLPDISGEEVLRRLRADAATKAIPVVILTADATSSQEHRLMQAGANAYLTKPFDVPRLLRSMESILNGAGTCAAPDDSAR